MDLTPEEYQIILEVLEDKIYDIKSLFPDWVEELAQLEQIRDKVIIARYAQ